MFLVILGIFVFNVATLEKAHDLCAPNSITKECYVEALQPITKLDYSKLN